VIGAAASWESKSVKYKGEGNVKLGIIFSNDWELCGDGSGDYFKIQHRPLQMLLEVMENHGAKLTIMAEVGQQWAHQELGSSNHHAAEISCAWDTILKDSIRRAMDVQLHFHPQWMGATYEGNKWKLNLSNWGLGSLPRKDLDNVLSRGKQYLDCLLKPIRPSYECIAFRAGAYCIEPSSNVIPSLLHAGIKCDTSVTKGFSHPLFYDYREAQSNVYPWITDKHDIKNSGRLLDGVLEIPIYSVPMMNSPILSKGFGIYLGATMSSEERRWFREGRSIGEERYPLAKRPFRSHMLKMSNVLRLLIRKSAVQLDYDSIPASMFVQMISRIVTDNERKLPDNDTIIPVMASGHVKQMHNTENVNRILDAVNQRFKGDIVHWTLQDATEFWLRRLKGVTA